MISLILTVRNEADNIARLLDSIVGQCLLPDEVVINDNGSCDGTVAIINQYMKQYPMIRLVHGVGNISQGRNRAIAHSRGDVIACCDAGVVLPKTWLALIVAPLLHDNADIVGGFTRPAFDSLWELALSATTLPDDREIDPRKYLPGARSVAFTRAAWRYAGGFPEWAETGEDLLFDLKLKEGEFRFAFVPEAFVYFRPRTTPKAHFRQYVAYAQGDGVANLWPWRHLVRYTAYSCLLAVCLLALMWSPLWLLILLPCVVAHTAQPYRRLWPRSRHLVWWQRGWVLVLVPFARLVGDVAKLIGYPMGIWRRYGEVGCAYS